MRRLHWAWVSSLWMMAALAVEAWMHPLSGALFDIAGDPYGLSGVVLLALAPAALETIHRFGLASPPENAAELARWGRALGACALLFASVLNCLLLPAYGLGWMGILIGCSDGVNHGDWRIAAWSALAYAPLPATVVLICQMRALCPLSRIAGRSHGVYLWGALSIAILSFIVRPAFVSYHVRQAVTTDDSRSRQRSVAALRWTRAEYDLRVLAYGRPPTFSTALCGFGLAGLFSRPDRTTAERAAVVYLQLTGRSYGDAPAPPLPPRVPGFPSASEENGSAHT